MKMNLVKSLVVLGLIASTQTAGAYTNKTFLKSRNQALVNLPLEQTGLKERTCVKHHDLFGGTFTVAGFYGQNTNKSDTGKYFGVTDLATFKLDTAAAALGGALATGITKSTTATVDPAYIIHKGTAIAAQTVGTLKLDPKFVHYGVDLVYYQDLSKILNGLYLKVNLPVNRVETDPQLSIAAGTDVGVISRDNLISYFKGTYAPGAGVDHQQALTHGKINGSRSATGVADIDVLVGYKFLNKEAYNMSVNLGLSIPTGKEATGAYLFEPLYGSKNFGFGGGLDAQARVWGDCDHNIKLDFTANYRYLFQASEKRTLGLKGRNWGQYHGLLDTANLAGAAAASRIVIPAANVLTQNLDITPGSQLDSIVDLNYNKGGFNVGLGYNLFFKEAESVKRKDAWTDTQYGIIARGAAISGGADLGAIANPAAIVVADLAFDNQTATAVGLAAIAAQNVLIKVSDMDLSAAETPSQLTHSVFGGVNYAFKNWEYPLLLGLGGKYEFASKNSALEGWQGWVKAGLSF